MAALLALTVPQAATVQGGVTPQPYVTRAEAAGILLYARNATIPVVADEGRYRDLVRGSWYEPVMLAAAKANIVEADQATQELRPNEFLNRAEFLKMLVRAFALEQGVATTFRDIDANGWYAPYTKIAQTSDLFPEDANIIELQPQKLMTFRETVLAVQTVLRTKAGPIPAGELVTRVQPIGGKSVFLSFSFQSGKSYFIGLPDGPDAEPQPQTIAQQRTELLELVNVTRTRYGLHPLSYNRLLEQSAQRYAEDMARGNFFSHVSPDGQTLKQRMEATGYYNRTYFASCNCVKGYAIAENLAIGQKSAREAYQAWMDSSEHKAALLGSDYTETGFGIANDSWLWVEHFGGILLPGNERLSRN